MKAMVYLVLMGVIVSFLIANASGRTLSLDPTGTENGRDANILRIEEMKYKYEIFVYIKNTHNICNISVLPGLYYNIPEEGVTPVINNPTIKKEWNLTSGNELDWYSGYSFRLTPQEEGSFSLMKITTGKTDRLAIKITAIFNKSAYNDQQTNVLVDYTIKVYDDRGELIMDSEYTEDPINTEDPDIINPIVQEDEVDSCCGQIIILGIGALLITSLLLKRLNRGKLK